MIEQRIASVLALVRVLAGAAPLARQYAPLNAAIARLRLASGEAEVERLDRLIWRFWGNAGTREAVANLHRANEAMAADRFATALRALDEAVAADFVFAEAWNRRATVHFIMGDHNRAISDIERVLILEPRHYGALSGLGQILTKEGKQAGALAAFEAALRVNPHLDRIRLAAAELRAALPRAATRPPILH
jgi:tetratricopeptide (TPR) repeat protein